MVTQDIAVLNLEQLRSVTMNDEPLMREILDALIGDTTEHLDMLREAIANSDANTCVQLAHYSKGACANVGAASSAAFLRSIEISATRGDFTSCGESFRGLAQELEKLKLEAETL